MKHVILLDTKVTEKEYEQWKKDDIAFWEKQIGVTPTYRVIRHDFSDYPTFTDSDGDIRPTNAYLQKLNDIAIKRDGDFGTDFVMVMIHQDNWLSDTTPDYRGDGIWGTNYSYAFGKQCLDYCRWDKDNPANTFGTAYHERHHSFDAIIKQELGVDIRPMLGVEKYDHEITHGHNPKWKYIRYKENLESLAIMKPYLQKAFAKRREREEKEILDLKGKVVSLAGEVLYLLKMQMNKKKGVKRT